MSSRLYTSHFQRLWLGLSISYLGDQFTIIALLWFVLQLTGSGAAVGLVILCFDLPGILTGAILGRLLDRYQPRLVMGFDNLARAALIAAIQNLLKEVGIPDRLSALGITAQMIPELSKKAMEDACHLLNPRPCTQRDMTELYEQAL